MPLSLVFPKCIGKKNITTENPAFFCTRKSMVGSKICDFNSFFDNLHRSLPDWHPLVTQRGDFSQSERFLPVGIVLSTDVEV